MKNKITLLILFSFAGIFTAAGQMPAYVPSNGLVGWWPFNGNANDESGNGNNGTVNGATLTSDRFGNGDKSYNFNNSNIVTSCTGIQTNKPRTISFWYNPSAINNTTDSWGIVGYGFNSLGGGSFDCILFPNSNNDIGIDISSSYAIYDNNSGYGNWKQCIVTFDSTFGNNVLSVKVYIDGNLQLNVNNSIGTQFQINTGSQFPLTIGGMNANYFSGKIDDIGIWNRALSQQEITNLYNSQTCIGNITADGPTTFCAGNSVNLKSDVLGGTYQWKKNGVNIATNSTSRTYKATSTGSYTCVATCNGTALTSNAIAVTSKTNASVTVYASGATSFCAGDSVTLNCTNLGSNYSVQWYRTNISMENATAYSQVVKQPGTYKVVTRNLTNGCSRISGSAITTNVNCRIANYSNISTTGDLNDEARFDATELSNGIKIYPNPNNGSFQFKYEGEESGDAQLQVINTMGQTVYRANVNIEDGFLLKEIMLGDNFQKGIYIVRLLINGGQNDSRVYIQ